MLERIGSKQNAKVNSFKFVALYGATEVAVKMAVNVNGKPGVKEIRGFSQVRKLFKQEIYRMAKLKPRTSDEDFHDGKMILESGVDDERR